MTEQAFEEALARLDSVIAKIRAAERQAESVRAELIDTKEIVPLRAGRGFRNGRDPKKDGFLQCSAAALVLAVAASVLSCGGSVERTPVNHLASAQAYFGVSD